MKRKNTEEIGGEDSCVKRRLQFESLERSQAHDQDTGPRASSLSKNNHAIDLKNAEKTESAKLGGPYSCFSYPNAQECKQVRDALLDFHGFPKEFERFRQRFYGNEEEKMVSSEVGKVDAVAYETHESILDSLVCTLLSQSSSEENARRAFASLKTTFPTWEEVHKADPKDVENCIRFGGLAETKTSRIKCILETLLKERGTICLEYVRDLSVEEIKKELSRFKGVGPKTVSCVLMFHLNQHDFPVDTHVLRISKSLGWVPKEADREKAYLHLNSRIPNDLKFDLNCLIFTHGKQCKVCSKKGSMTEDSKVLCPLSRFRR